MIRQLEPDTPDADTLSPTEVQSQAFSAPPTTEPPESPSVLLDVLAAPFRGAEDAVRNVYNLADYIVADSLPDYGGDKNTNFLGTSATTAGSVVEGVSQFLAGFIPVAGQASRVGAALGLAGKAAQVGGAAALGAAVDFAAFSGHDERLSNLIEAHPALANPITDFLAAKPGDTEVFGRFKNAVEGLGLGALVDAITPALSAVKAGRALKTGTETPAGATKALTEAQAAVEKGLPKIEPPPIPAMKAHDIPDGFADIADAVTRFDPSSVEGSGLFQFPEKSIALRVETTDDVVKLLEATTTALKKTPSESRATLEAKASEILGAMTGRDAGEVVASFRAREAVMQDAAHHDYALGKLMVATANEASYYAKIAAAGSTVPGLTVEQTLLRSLKAQELLSSFVSISKGMGTVEGRALNARKFIKSAQLESANVARDLVEQLGGSAYLTPEVRKLALAGASDNPLVAAKGVSDLVRKQMTMGGRLLRAHNEYWINAVLSGPKTTLVDVLGQTMTTFYQPLEQAIGSAFQKDLPAVRASLKNYAYLAHAVSDSWSIAVKAFKEGEHILTPKRGGVADTLTQGPAIDGAKLVKGGVASEGLVAEGKAVLTAQDNLLSHFINFTGETVRMPTRFLLSSEEFFKQLNYRAGAKTELYYRGLNRGLAGDALHGYVADGFAKTITEGGERYSEAAIIGAAEKQATSKGLTGRSRNEFIRDFKAKHWDPANSALAEAYSVADLAAGIADEATFTTPLGTMGKAVQTFVSSHPIFQLVVPFVRTPTNIVKYASQRGAGALTFLPGIGKLQVRNSIELASENGLVRSRAMGRIAAGQMVVSMSALAALNGKLTGAGPKDPDEKKLLMATGWQPYSFKLDTAEGPTYVSYQRLDPLATFLGLVADWSEQAKRQDPFHADTLQTTITAAATAMSNNVTNKTYLASLAQVVDMVTDPQRKFLKWERARVGSYVPSALAQLTATMDDDQSMREIRGFFDGALNRLPGARNLLEPKRNVLGSAIDGPLTQTPMGAINPFTISRDKNDPLMNELATFGHGLQAPSPLVLGKINLLDFQDEKGRTAYDRYQQITGEATLNGRTLQSQLNRLIESAGYQRMSSASPGDGYDSPRLAAVRRVIGAYRRAALAQVQREYPKVQDAVRGYMAGQAAYRRGDRAQALQGVQSVIAASQ